MGLECESKFSFLQLKYLNRWSWKKDVTLAKVEREGEELKLEITHMDLFFMVEEAKDFRVVGTATVSVKVWEQKAKEKQMSNVVAPLPLPSHLVSCWKTAEGKKFKLCTPKERIVSDLFI